MNVVWFNVTDRLRKNCTTMLNWMFDAYECVHYTGSIPDVDGAVVVVHGESCMDAITKLSTEIQKLKWVVLIYLGDECQTFPIERITHPNMKLWVQDADPRRAAIIDRYLPGGWAPGSAHVDVPRDLDWFFAGQITHEHRRQCIKALEEIPGGGFYVCTKGYTQGISSAEYIRSLSRAKFIPCPSGPVSPDSTRVWEALECGAVPIVDASSPQGRNGFWDLQAPSAPFRVIQGWQLLPTILEELLRNYDDLQQKTALWWKEYKAAYLLWLEKDIQELIHE